MKFLKKITIQFTFFSVGLIVACGSENMSTKKESKGVQKNDIQTVDSKKEVKMEEEIMKDSIPKNEISVVVIPCSNGYEYAIQGYEIESILEKTLKNTKNVKVEKFPLWKFKGSGYQGVYDKKHCVKILQNTDAEFIVMSRLIGGVYTFPTDAAISWGYETKILNAKTKEQLISIYAKNLGSFEEVEKDIELKINEMVEDFKR